MSDLIDWISPWFGDCPIVTNYLKDRKGLFFLLRILDTFLRSVGQVVFINNPICGLLILVSFFISSPEVGLACLLGGCVATLTEFLFGLHPKELVINGVAPLNGVLVGSVTVQLYEQVYNVDQDLTVWLAICMGGIISVFFGGAFNNFFSPLKLPYFTLPFNLVAIISFLSLGPQNMVSKDPEIILNSTLSLLEITNKSVEEEFQASPSWLSVSYGCLLSFGQVYAMNDILASIVICLAMFLYSPYLMITSFIGSIIGSFLSLTLLPPQDWHQIYDGIWGYNSLLSMPAISCVFLNISPSSLVFGLVSVVVTVASQQAIRVNMNHLPVFTLPFTLSCLVMLLAVLEVKDKQRTCIPEFFTSENNNNDRKQDKDTKNNHERNEKNTLDEVISKNWI